MGLPVIFLPAAVVPDFCNRHGLFVIYLHICNIFPFSKEKCPFPSPEERLYLILFPCYHIFHERLEWTKIFKNNVNFSYNWWSPCYVPHPPSLISGLCLFSPRRPMSRKGIQRISFMATGRIVWVTWVWGCLTVLHILIFSPFSPFTVDGSLFSHLQVMLTQCLGPEPSFYDVFVQFFTWWASDLCLAF